MCLKMCVKIVDSSYTRLLFTITTAEIMNVMLIVIELSVMLHVVFDLFHDAADEVSWGNS